MYNSTTKKISLVQNIQLNYIKLSRERVRKYKVTSFLAPGPTAITVPSLILPTLCSGNRIPPFVD